MVSKPLWVFVDVINMYNQLTLNKGGDLISQALAEEQQSILAVMGGASGDACLSTPPALSPTVSRDLKGPECVLAPGEIKTQENPCS